MGKRVPRHEIWTPSPCKIFEKVRLKLDSSTGHYVMISVLSVLIYGHIKFVLVNNNKYLFPIVFSSVKLFDSVDLLTLIYTPAQH